MNLVISGIVLLACLLNGTKEGSTYLLDRHCGTKSEPLIPYIAGGSEVSIYENPWMVRIISKSREVSNLCSGSLITSRFVLTAAHCVDHNTSTYALLGDYSIIDPEPDCSSGVCIPIAYKKKIDRKIRHEDYNKGQERKFDIALLRMESDVTFSVVVKPICLLVDEEMGYVSKFDITGWGMTENGGESQTLLTATVHRVERWFCEIKYRVHTDESQICAGSHTSRTCYGDSGGPLSAERRYFASPRVFQYGLVSYGSSNCTNSGTFGVYTNVLRHMDWIVRKISGHSSETNQGSVSLVEENCGRIKCPSRVRRLAGGQDAERFANPWMVMVFSENDFICGGSLITSRFVLTAAYCSSSLPDKVRLGAHHINITDNTYEINIDRTISHPQYYYVAPFQNDIGLLRMERNVIYSDYVRPICIPGNKRMSDVLTFNVAGWGMTEKGKNSETLQTATVYNTDIRFCERVFNLRVDQSQICGISYSTSTCSGDGGGPLSAKRNYGRIRRVFQYGVVSYGPLNLCLSEPSLRAYTNVTHFLDWIQDTIRDNN